MSDTVGTLLSDNAYSDAKYATAKAARDAWEAAQPTTPSLAKRYPLLAVVGDMVSDPDDANRDAEEGNVIAARFKDVANTVTQSNCDLFVCLGDNVYESGQLANYQVGYHDTFGRVLPRTLPMLGNHEYLTPGAAGYFTYFGQRAGNPNGWYAYNVGGNWRLYSLNSNSAAYVTPASSQMAWLSADLANNPTKNLIAAWHHPRWTDGAAAVSDDPHYDYLWQTLYNHGHCQIVLVGHDHNYQRWDTIKSGAAPGNTDGTDGSGNSIAPVRDTAMGITQFVVGCGGNGFFTLAPARNTGGPGNAGRSDYGHDRAFGVLFLRLGPTSYDWLFKSIDGTVIDSGTRATH